jgi:hypothetical protein
MRSFNRIAPETKMKEGVICLGAKARRLAGLGAFRRCGVSLVSVRIGILEQASAMRRP